MVKSLPKLLYHGVKIFVASIRKSIQEEIEMSRELARIRYQEVAKEKERERTRYKMSLEEAQRVLNIQELDPEVVEKRYNYLFSANKGFLYLQSKIYRAKEVVDFEISKTKATARDKKKTMKSLENNGKCLFFTYMLLNEKK